LATLVAIPLLTRKFRVERLPAARVLAETIAAHVRPAHVAGTYSPPRNSQIS
jgi:hypothetical protein